MTPEQLPRPLRAALSPGEVVLWAGKPATARASAGGGVGQIGRRLALAGLGVALLAVVILIVTPAGTGAARPLPALLVTGGVLAGLAGLGLMVHGYATRDRAQRTTYLLTDLRAYLFEEGIGADPVAWDLNPARPPLVIGGGDRWQVLFLHRLRPVPDVGPPQDDRPQEVEGSGFDLAPADPKLLAALSRFGVTQVTPGLVRASTAD